MNRIINMVIRQIMRRLFNKGIDAGFNRAGRMGNRKKQQDVEIDDYGNPVQRSGGQRNGRQSARRAKQSMKVMRKIGRF